jgi:hypothetical protein
MWFVSSSKSIWCTWPSDRVESVPMKKRTCSVSATWAHRERPYTHTNRRTKLSVHDYLCMQSTINNLQDLNIEMWHLYSLSFESHCNATFYLWLKAVDCWRFLHRSFVISWFLLKSKITFWNSAHCWPTVKMWTKQKQQHQQNYQKWSYRGRDYFDVFCAGQTATKVSLLTQPEPINLLHAESFYCDLWGNVKLSLL